MDVQVNAPHGTLPAPFADTVTPKTEAALSAFAEKLTRVEVYFKDTNAQKGGIDIHCTVEARPRGLQPVAVTAEGQNHGEALDLALDKLENALENRFGKLESRKHER